MPTIRFQTQDGPRKVFISWKVILTAVGVLAVLFVFNTSFYSVEAGEVGVIQRFGKYVRKTGSGLHFKLPWGIEKVSKVNVEYRYKEEFGFHTVQAGITSRFETAHQSEFEKTSLMLTGDLNSAVVEWSVQYNIKDPRSYLFNVRNPERTLRDMCESIMREIVGDRSVTEVLTMGREEINVAVRDQLQGVLDAYESGIKITQVICQNVLPPRDVKSSFDEVNTAQQEMSKIENQARAEFNRVIPKARGNAQKMINEAEGYKQQRINRAAGDVARFRSILTEYQKAPEITRQRIYLETMAKILPKIKHKVVIDEDARSILPLLELGNGGKSK